MRMYDWVQVKNLIVYILVNVTVRIDDVYN